MSRANPPASTEAGSEEPLVVSGHISHKYGLLFILTAFTILGLLYDFTVPLFEKPDELKHFAVIQYVQTQRQLPVVQAGVYRPWDQEGTQPPLYHILAATLVSWLDLSRFEEPPRNPHYVDERSFVWRERGNNNLYLHAPDEVWSTAPVFLAARLSRWLSLLAGLGTVTLTFVLGHVIFDTRGANNDLPLLAAALVAFIPQFLHVSSAITNDSLSVTVAAATLVLLALVIKNGSSTRYIIYLGLALGVGAITKLSLLYLLPLTGLVLLLDLRHHRSVLRLLVYGAIIGGLMALLAGWWYVRNWQLYGDLTALNTHLLYRGGPLDPKPSLAQIWRTEIVGLELSFWAAFGAGQILLEPWLYEGLRWLKYAVLVGLIIGVVRISFDRQPRLSRQSQVAGSKLQVANGRSRQTELICLAVLAVWTLLIFVALLGWMQITPASWGRLLYPTLPALGILSAWGLSQFKVHNSKLLIQDLHLPIIIATALFVLALISPFRYIQDAYAKTPLRTEAEIPSQEMERLGFVYDDALRLLGYRLDRSAVQPGEWLPVTLYWQATRPIDINYSVFVHVLDQTGQAIAQTNTYPDQGNWPTSMLEPQRVLEDTYYVLVPAQVEAPLATRLALGIFEFEDPERVAKSAVNPLGEIVEPIVEGVPIVPHRWPDLKPTQRLEVNFGEQIELVGYDWPANRKIEPGATVLLTLYWKTLKPPGQNLNLFIHLIDPATQTQIAGFDGPPDYPTSYWQTGNTIIDSRSISVPKDLSPGDYELRIGWYNLADFARLPLIGDSVSGDDALSVMTVSVEK